MCNKQNCGDMSFAISRLLLRLHIQSIIVFMLSTSQCLSGSDKTAYSFQYSVESGNVVTHHWEERRGDLVHGSYSLLEPDGRIRVVEYRADDFTGFQASVKHRNIPPGSHRLGHLTHPGPAQKPIKLAHPINFLSKESMKTAVKYPIPPKLY